MRRIPRSPSDATPTIANTRTYRNPEYVTCGNSDPTTMVSSHLFRLRQRPRVLLSRYPRWSVVAVRCCWRASIDAMPPPDFPVWRSIATSAYQTTSCPRRSLAQANWRAGIHSSPNRASKFSARFRSVGPITRAGSPRAATHTRPGPPAPGAARPAAAPRYWAARSLPRHARTRRGRTCLVQPQPSYRTYMRIMAHRPSPAGTRGSARPNRPARKTARVAVTPSERESR